MSTTASTICFAAAGPGRQCLRPKRQGCWRPVLPPHHMLSRRSAKPTVNVEVLVVNPPEGICL